MLPLCFQMETIIPSMIPYAIVKVVLLCYPIHYYSSQGGSICYPIHYYSSQGGSIIMMPYTLLQ